MEFHYKEYLLNDKIYPISLHLVYLYDSWDAFDEWIIDFVRGSYDGMLRITILYEIDYYFVSHPS